MLYCHYSDPKLHFSMMSQIPLTYLGVLLAWKASLSPLFIILEGPQRDMTQGLCFVFLFNKPTVKFSHFKFLLCEQFLSLLSDHYPNYWAALMQFIGSSQPYRYVASFSHYSFYPRLTAKNWPKSKLTSAAKGKIKRRNRRRKTVWQIVNRSRRWKLCKNPNVWWKRRYKDDEQLRESEWLYYVTNWKDTEDKFCFSFIYF